MKRQRTAFGEIVRDRREKKGWTQEQLRQEMTRAGAPVTQGYVSKIELSDRVPNGLIVAGLATVLEIPRDELFGGLLKQPTETMEEVHG